MSEDERRSLVAAFDLKITAAPRENVIHQGESRDSVTLLVNGCACAHAAAMDGRRHILAVFFPGDFCDLSRLFHSRDAFAVQALGPCVFARARVTCLNRTLAAQPGLALALFHESVLETARMRCWVSNLGRSSAHTRTAHLLCEFYFRSSHAGLAHKTGCPFPLTQTDLADALGLSIVQVNRVLQSFRRADILALERGLLRIHDLARLADIGAFSPAYLALEAGAHFSANSAA